MKRGTYVLIIFLIFFLLIGLALASFLYLEFAKPPGVSAYSYLEVPLHGSLQEKAAPDFLAVFFGIRPSLSMYDLWINFQKARRDRRIRAVVLRLGYLQCDWAKIQELRDLVLDFRKSGKKVYAVFEEMVDADKEYYLATACDTIILHPLGQMFINGIGGYVPFFKKGLDKLGIAFEVEHVEEYKTAMNQFTESGFTPAHREMMESLYGDIYKRYIQHVSEARQMTEKDIQALLDRGFFQGPRAKEAGLVDELLYADEIQELLQENGKRLSRITHSRYLKIKPSAVGLFRGRKIALIYGMGPIHTGEGIFQTMGAATVARWLRKARRDSSIEAVVFRVDSPGGSAVGSDIIWREIVLTKKEKPVVVSMSDVAGSGGYWVSMAAHKIVAQPQTLTGSIGVVFGKANLKRLYDKLGITSEKLAFGKNADIFSSFKTWSDADRHEIKKEIRWLYEQFLAKVASGRGMTEEEVDRIGRGRVWTGKQALERGLVDETGGLSRAIEIAKELAGIPKSEQVRLVVQPKKVSLLDMLFGRREVGIGLAKDSKWEKALETLKLLEQEKMWALMPLMTLED